SQEHGRVDAPPSRDRRQASPARTIGRAVHRSPRPRMDSLAFRSLRLCPFVSRNSSRVFPTRSAQRRIVNQQPNSNFDPRSLENCELRIMELEERLRPIARRPVDITQPNWLDRLRASAPPSDEADVREPAAQLVSDLISAYAQGSDETRSAIRRMFAEYVSFAWAAALSTPRTTAAGFRQHLILFSMKDQGRDGRD